MSDTLSLVDWSKWDSKENQFAKYKHVASELIYGSLPANKLDISVIIPTFRRADLLKETIDSVLAQKTQYNFVIVVVDNDGETDQPTDELLKEYCSKHDNIVYYRNTQNIGMFGNWNRCIELSPTEWFCMLHDDDMLMEDYIETMYPIAKGSEYGVIGSYKTVLDERKDSSWNMSGTGRGKFVSSLIDIFIKIRRGKAIPITNKDSRYAIFFPATIFFTNKLKAISAGGYDETFFPVADVAFIEKMMKYYGAAFIPTPLYIYRIAKNESLKKQTKWDLLLKMPYLMKAVQSSLGTSSEECVRAFFECMIIGYYSLPDIKNTLVFSDVAHRYQVPAKYNKQWRRRWIMFKYYLAWGLLLFRSSK